MEQVCRQYISILSRYRLLKNCCIPTDTTIAQLRTEKGKPFQNRKKAIKKPTRMHQKDGVWLSGETFPKHTRLVR